MMSDTTSPFIINVTQESFTTDVLQRSQEVPVLVDFWAPWCAPCRQLGPMLEKLAQEFNGGFILAKVNTEENPSLAQDFQIRSIPNVLLFRNGQPADGFVGVYPEAQIRAFLQRHCPTEADRWLAEARAQEEAESMESAAALYRKVLALDADNPAAHLALGRMALRQGRVEEARTHLQAIPSLTSEGDTAARLLELIGFLEENPSGDEAAYRKEIAADPANLDARYRLAAHLAAAHRYPEALEELLAIIAKNKRYREEAPRKTMLALFSLLGERSPLSDEYRQRLARTLY